MAVDDKRFFIHMTNKGQYWSLPDGGRVTSTLTYGPYNFDELGTKLAVLQDNGSLRWVNSIETVEL